MEKDLKLDTPGTLFPAVTRKTNTSVYRIAAVLLRAVDPAALQRAADSTLKRFPSFSVSFETSAFGERLAHNAAPVVVREETDYPCMMIDPQRENGHLLRILYYGNRISLEAFHALADGIGAMELLKTLIYQYFLECGETLDAQGKIMMVDENPRPEETEDAMLRYYRENAPKKNAQKREIAFKIKGTVFRPYGTNIVDGILPVADLKTAAKRNNATITEYLTAVLIYSIYREEVNAELDHEPIVISVPANLREIAETKTLRNCFCIVNISVPLKKKLTFEETLRDVKAQFAQKMNRENLESSIAESCGAFEHPIVKNVPRFMREAGTRFAFAFFAENLKTMTLSNVGQVDLPDDIKKRIDRIEAVVYPTERSPINCCMCSANGKMVISFIRSIRETRVIRAFFGFLSREVDAKIEISTNDWGKQNEEL